MKNQASCTKAIPYHKLLTLQEIVERLHSWDEPLAVLEQFFSDQSRPVNKRRIIQEYHACAQLFQLFHTNYSQLIKEENELLKQLLASKKVQPDSN